MPNHHLQAEVIPETVGQFTGLTDKNGKRIFEGDIVRYYEIDDEEETTAVAVVVYGISNNYPAFDLSDHDFECNALSHIFGSGQYAIEVIGNVHDNPELLEAES